MPIVNRLSLPQQKLSGTVVLEPSKSISNRALVIRSLCKEPFEIHRLSSSDDTDALIAMLASTEEVLYSGHAGSSYRFMVARACLGDREVTIDASEQLRRRPIGPLVKALQALGADITYLNKEGFPPLKVKPVKGLGKKVNEVTLQAGISSQYLTALLLIAPMLPKGLTVHLTGEPVSASYIQMTLAMMEYFGVPHQWTDNTIRVEHGGYKARDYSVEGDWSSASYLYSMAALAESAEISIEGLKTDSIQGDVVTKDIYAQLGVETTITENGIHIQKKGIKEKLKEFKYDFSRCPDIAQTVMVTLAGLGIKGVLSGLQTLRIKESDRIMAMYTELERVKTKLLVKEEADNLTVIVVGKAKWKDRAKFNTYEDHRMAMAFVPLGCIHPVIIKDPDVVSKSYPGFWKDIESIGIKIEKQKIK
ncbi:MAG: 3-phosphoshikimate 1-carboxyvinyltransferase [Saprospiraceae bacterium]|nr:3-phosphoshikimate 1-carboxyvinyltransferase [Candidatus Opimibacter iunctus]